MAYQDVLSMGIPMEFTIPTAVPILVSSSFSMNGVHELFGIEPLRIKCDVRFRGEYFSSSKLEFAG